MDVLTTRDRLTDAIPLSVNQEAMWVSWQIHPDRFEHVVPAPLVVTGELEMPRLRHAVARLAARHPMLRGRVHRAPDGVYLTWRDAGPIDVTERVVTGTQDDAVLAAGRVPLDLDRGPLTRVEVLHGPDYTVLLITVHHIVFDGTSFAVLLDELRQGYGGAPFVEPDDPAPLVRHAERSRAMADGELGSDDRRYWRDVLAEPPTGPSLPYRASDGRYHLRPGRIEADLVERLRELALSLDISYFTVVFGALFLVLRHHSGSDDLIVSAPYHGRSDPELATRIGFFVNALPFRRKLSDSDTYEQFLRGLRTAVRDGVTHGDVPLPALLRAANLVGPQAHDLTHQAVFEYWNSARGATVVDIRHLELVGEHSRCVLRLLDAFDVADYAINVMLVDDASGSTMIWKDPAGRLGPDLLDRLADDYLAVLRDMVADPARTLAEGATHLPAPTARTEVPTVETASSHVVPPDVMSGVAAAWSDVLRIPVPDVEDSFFELGGHSLLATSLLDRVGARFGVRLTLPDLFDSPRLGDFAAIVAARAGSHSTGPTAAVATDEPVPASGFQESIWLAERLDPTGARYHVPLSWEVKGALDPTTLRTALALLVTRQELLRTRFVDRDGRLHLVPTPPWAPDLAGVDLCGMPTTEQERRLREWTETAADGFSLDEGRLLVAGLHTLSDDRQVLSLCLHHLVLDGRSVPVLLKELRRCYAAAEGVLAPLAPPERGYRDLLAAHRDAGAALDYWERQLAGAPSSLGLPTPAAAEPDGRVDVEISESTGLARVRADHQVSWFMVVAAAVAAVLHRWTGRTDITFGFPVADRGGAAFADVVGPSMNTLVLRSRCDDATTLADLLRALRAEIIGAFEHREASFEAVVARLRPRRSPGRTPYVDLLLNSVDQTDWATELGAAQLVPWSLADQLGVDSKVGLTVTMITAPDGLSITVTHRGDQVGHADAEGMAGELAAILHGFADHLDRPVLAGVTA